MYHDFPPHSPPANRRRLLAWPDWARRTPPRQPYYLPMVHTDGLLDDAGGRAVQFEGAYLVWKFRLYSGNAALISETQCPS